MTRKATPADHAQTLPDRILAEISWAHSRKPANADDVLALVGGDAAVFWSAVEQLKRECRINAATIKTQLDAAPWMAIWPTGTPVRHRSWKDLNAVGAFGTHPAGTIHQHMPCRRDPERDPRPDLRQVTAKAAGKVTQIHGPERRDRIATLAAGRTLEQGITFHDVAADLGISVEGVRYLVKRMAHGSRVAVGKLPNEHAHRLYDPTAQASADVSLTNEGDMPAQASDEAPDPLPHQVVEPADQAMVDPLLRQVVEPADTARLARLLGVPGNPLPAQEART